MPKFYRMACGRKIFADAQFVGMGTTIKNFETGKVLAHEYQWFVRRPDGYCYALDHLIFLDIYKPADRRTKQYIKDLHIESLTKHFQKRQADAQD